MHLGFHALADCRKTLLNLRVTQRKACVDEEFRDSGSTGPETIWLERIGNLSCDGLRWLMGTKHK